MDEQALTTDMHYVFGVDALQTSRPMNIPVVTTDDMDVMFDAISYEKGTHRYSLSFETKLAKCNQFHIILITPKVVASFE